MSVHIKKLKLITFRIGDETSGTQFECQVQSWSLDPGIEDGDLLYSYCPDGVEVDEVDPTPSLELTFYSDWRSEGISAFLWENNGMVADFLLEHHPDDPESFVTWSGKVKVKPGPVGGEVRENEMTEVTLQCVGMPTFARGGAA